MAKKSEENTFFIALKGRADAENKLKQLQKTVSSFSPMSIASSDISREGHGIFARWSRKCGFPHASQVEAEERQLALERTTTAESVASEGSKTRGLGGFIEVYRGSG